MIKGDDDPVISETLNVIKKALEEKSNESFQNDALLLNKLVQEDGTILTIKESYSDKNDISDGKIEKSFDKHLTKWLDKNMPNIINKYLNKNR